MSKAIKKIAITGGKGGTGKSTFSVLLVRDLLVKGKKIVLCDCDVECPNDHLLLDKKIRNVQEKVYAEFPVLNNNECTKCGLCAKVCRENAIFQPRDKNGDLGFPIFIRDLCAGCGACWTVCPYGAIKTEKEEVGKIYLENVKLSTPPKTGRDNFYLISGVAKEGLEETSSIVAGAKKFAKKFAEEIKADYILFDTAAGTHCPVVSVLIDVDLIYCVTEPTPMGAVDLSLILEIIKKIKTPAEIVLNQANLGNRKLINKVAEKYKVKIEKEIPYSKEIAKAYSSGNLLNSNLVSSINKVR